MSTSIPLAILMFFQHYFLTDVAGLPPAYAAWAVGISRLWDAVNDPLFGLWSDGIRTRWGRRRVLLLFDAVPLGVSFMLMWVVPSFELLGLTIYYTLAYIIFGTVFTVVHVGYNALTPEMTSDYDERSSLNGYRMVFSIAGSLGAIIFATVLSWSITATQQLYLMLGVGLGIVDGRGGGGCHGGAGGLTAMRENVRTGGREWLRAAHVFPFSRPHSCD